MAEELLNKTFDELRAIPTEQHLCCPKISDDDDEDLDGSATPLNGGAVPDNLHDFWLEWNDVRARLQSWQMDASNISTPNNTSSQEYELGQRDLLHINESFRYSALLYTERLGSPLLPSSHDNFQTKVTNALFHITSLE